MKIYAHYGFKDFILCLSYKGEKIKEHFLNYEAMNSDSTTQLDNRNNILFHSNHQEKNWNVTLIDTGEEVQTGARIKRIEKYIDSDLFTLTYGDGVANMNVKSLLEFHKLHGMIGIITGVHPSSRFGEFVIKKNRVIKFHEKPQVSQGLINGGFLYLIGFF